MTFSQEGDTYRLSSVKKPTVNNGNTTYTQVASGGEHFFPLDDIDHSAEQEKSNPHESTYKSDCTNREDHNYYFGMRYDVDFKLGDYIGPLNYSFTGDDDLWVLYDGQVVLDLGGIHDKAPATEDFATVDLWKTILDKSNYGYEDKEKYSKNLSQKDKEAVHTITVLYMERGAGESNCTMNFTLPSAEIVNVSEQKKTTLTLKKQDTKGNNLKGAKFQIKKNAIVISEAESDANGDVTLNNLPVGEYILEETKAPDTYATPTNEWIVKVTLGTDGNPVARLYKEDTVTEVDKMGSAYKIVNETPEEIINSSMEYNKTAKVIDWDKRTYKIDINASSKATSSSVTEKTGTADIMMVFDMSGSMNEDGKKADIGKYDNIKEQLDKTKVYYYNTKGQTSNVSGNTYYTNPMIYIDGAWKYYNGNGWKEPTSSDVYGYWESDYGQVSTWNSRITALKEAAIAFIKDTATKSPKSKIGIATFDGSSWYSTRGNLIQSIQEVGSQPSEMIKNICKITADGGTSPQEGLKKAKEQLNLVKDDNLPKNIILFTDGAPSYEEDTKETETIIGTLKNEATIFTVALGSENKTVPGSNKTNIEWMKGLATDEKHAFSVSDSSGLGNIFQKINETITQNINIENATIIDVIDSRFVILDDNGNPITKNGTALKNRGIVKFQPDERDGNGNITKKGYQYIIWEKETIKHSSKNGTTITPGWSKSITVKAKDEYIGGNNIPTNIYPDSKITTEYGEAILPQPKVNVKMDLVVNDHSEEVFDGERSPYTTTIENNLFNKAAPQGYVTDKEGNKNLVTYTIGSDGTPIKQEDFALTWYKDVAWNDDITPADPYMDANENPRPNSTNPGKYYLKVTYKGSEPATDSSNSNTDAKNNTLGDGNTFSAYNSNDKSNDEKRFYGEYTITVKQGKIIIQKNLLSDSEYLNKKKPNFSFKVTRIKDADGNALDSNDSKNLVGFSLDKGDFSNNPLTATISAEGLSKGVYQVEEVLPVEGYEFKDGSIDTTEPKCDSVLSENKKIATFAIGYENYSEAGYSYRDGKGLDKDQGKVIFTNQRLSSIQINKIGEKDEEGKDKLLKGARFEIAKKDKDNKYVKVQNVGTDENGNNVDYIETAANGEASFNDLPEGDYQITEIQSPAGYTLLANPIEVSLPYVVTNSSKTDIVPIDSKKVNYGGADHYYEITYTIKNNKLFNMPASGGRFKATLIGIAVMIMAAGCYILRHRRKRII